MHYKISPISGGLGNKFLSVLGILSDLNLRHGMNYSYSISDPVLRILNLQQEYKFIQFPYRKLSGLETGSVIFSDKAILINNHFICVEQDYKNSVLGVHFRGGDFASWKPHSIIPLDYFIDNIKRLGIRTIILCTDDTKHIIYNELKAWLLLNKYEVLIPGKGMIEDLYALASCNYILASPSTFSLTAAILGSRNIIFPKKFADREALDGDIFWKNVLDQRPSNYLSIKLS